MHSQPGGRALWQVTVTDRRLLLLMIQPTCRTSKQGPSPEVFLSSVSIEFISLERHNGHITKKQVIEKSKFDARPVFSSSPDNDSPPPIDSLPPSTDADTPQADVDGSTEPKGNATSRAVSVGTLLPCHITSLFTSHRPNSLNGCHTANSFSTSFFT